MKTFNDLWETPKNKRKIILLLDTNNNSEDNYDEAILKKPNKMGKKNKKIKINNIKNEQMKTVKINNKRKKNISKFKMLRNFSSKFKEGLLCLENPSKSTFAKRILNEILPQGIVKQNKKIIIKSRRKFSETDKDLIGTPKRTINFLSNAYLIHRKNSFINDNNSSRSYSHKIEKDNNFYSPNKREINLHHLSFSNYSSLSNSNPKNYLFEHNYKGSYIQEDINEEKNNNNNSEDESFFLLSRKSSKSKSRKSSIKLNLKTIPFKPPKRLTFKLQKKKSIKKESLVKLYRKSFILPDLSGENIFLPIISEDNANNKNKKNKNNKRKINKIPKPSTPQKLYLKKCDLKKHLNDEKFVCKFLSPINKFMNANFKMTNNEYEEINKNIHDLNYLINNNDYSTFIDKRKKVKYHEFIPPKIPDIQKIMENKYSKIISKIKNYKFKI